MQFNPEYLPYLAGEKQSAGLKMKMARTGQHMGERVDVLCSAMRGRSVIHVGCLDHVPLIEPRINADIWLHKRLTDVASHCLGIDINDEGIALADRLGYGNIVRCDIVEDAPHAEITARRWDYMLLGEVLEHVDNPVLFLRSIATKYAGCVDRLLLTVPNAFHLDNLLGAFRHVEKINTDHRFWFTPYTLAKVADSAGLRTVEYQLCLHKPNVPKRRILYRGLLRLFPLMRGSLIMELAFR